MAGKAISGVCFVVMGFGKKTDFETGRTLDLDATYDAIIKPAVDKVGLRCIRADEICHSGIIDAEMYEMLLRADLVIADISTGNANALYELGVRHALRPNSTIIMKEDQGRFYFDLDHIVTLQYEHLCKDIGHKEAKRAKKALRSIIKEAIKAEKPDSPVYTFLPKLEHPKLTDEEYSQLVEGVEKNQELLSGLIKTGEAAIDDSSFPQAVECFSKALELKPGDRYIIQRLVLSTYKSKSPSHLQALINASTLLKELHPDASNDPETLGLAGAISKRFWDETGDTHQLDKAISYYNRGYEVSKDYYNGENLATCHMLRSKIQTKGENTIYDVVSAKNIRKEILGILTAAMKKDSFSERSDKKWVYATLAHCSLAVGDKKLSNDAEKMFMNEKPANWEIDTYKDGKKRLKKEQSKAKK